MTSKRSISSANETATLDAIVRPVMFARLDFSSGVRRFHTHIGSRDAVHPVHGSETYTGLGDFGGIAGGITESVSKGEQKIDLALTGLDSTVINDTLVDDYYRRDADILIGFDDATGTLVDDPIMIFSGFMETADVTLDKGVAGVRLRLESRAANLNRSSDNRYTDEDKQIEVSGDLFARYVWRMADLELFWGDRALGGNIWGVVRDRSGRDGRRNRQGRGG